MNGSSPFAFILATNRKLIAAALVRMLWVALIPTSMAHMCGSLLASAEWHILALSADCMQCGGHVKALCDLVRGKSKLQDCICFKVP